MSRLKIKSIETAVKTFYSVPELGTIDIMELFGCSRSAAQKLKRNVQNQQQEQGVLTFSNSAVNTRFAFQVWGLDIKDFEQRFTKYCLYKKKGVFAESDL